MNKLFVLAVLSMMVVSCNKDETPLLIEKSSTQQGDYIIFGTYFGFTPDRPSVDIFLLNNEGISQDINKTYPNSQMPYNGSYQRMSIEDFNKAKHLLDIDYSPLLNVADTVIGCPDCADGGGIYFEYKSSNTHRFWLIDRTKYQVPENLHFIVDELDSTTRLFWE